MKKTLVALAAVSAVSAFAQTTVAIKGLVDAGYQSNDYKGNKVAGINNNGAATSQIDFEIIEDLGGGLKAKVWLESDINPVSTGANAGAASSFTGVTNSVIGTWLNSEQKVGLAGNFGEVAMGVVNDKTLAANGTGQPFGTAIASGYGSIIKASAGLTPDAASVVRFDNSVRYDTPVINGFSGSIYYAAKQATANGKNNFSTTLGAYGRPGINEYSLNYANGPLNAYLVQHQADYNGVLLPAAATTVGTQVIASALSSKTTMRTLAANYTLGGFTFGGTTQTLADDKSTKVVDTKATLMSVKYTMGNNMVGVTSGQLTNNVSTLKSKFIGVGYQYKMSKATYLYAQQETLNDDGGTVAAVTGFTEVGTKRSRTGLGIVVTF
jgi:predicted porin